MSYATRAETPQLRNVLLSGELGKKFGRRHRFAVNSPAEAVRALCANFPGFQEHVVASGERGVGYRVLAGKSAVALDEIGHPTGGSDIRIVPIVSGGKGGIWMVVAGVALIAASFIPGLNVAVWAAAGGAAGAITYSGIALGIGMSLLLGGITQMLSPQPKTSNTTKQTSYEFSGAVNSTQQGLPVPVGYGELIVGSAVISGGVTVDQIPTNVTGPQNLAAIVTQNIGAGGVVSYVLTSTWTAAGQATAYDVTVQGPGFGPVTLARTTGTTVLEAVPGPGPYSVVVNPVESNGKYGPTASCLSQYVPAG